MESVATWQLTRGGNAEVTTFTSEHQARRMADIDARRKQAWTSYNESLRDLDGREYEDAETRSWDRLQSKLTQLDEERQLLEAG
jgi:hypothetical protein